MEFVNRCLLCDGEGSTLYEHLLDRLYGVPGTFNYSVCSKCGFTWLNPRPSKEDIPQYYPSYYTRESSFFPSDNKNYIKKLRNRIRSMIIEYSLGPGTKLPKKNRVLSSLLSRIHTYYYSNIYKKRPIPPLHQKGRLLDIGCGNGHFLYIMKKTGWSTFGVEIDPESSRIARELYKLSIFNGYLEDAHYQDHSFDAITITHVIEHLHDPISLLKESHRILCPGGRIYITTPNLESLGHRTSKKNWFALEPPRHLHLWTPRTLRKTLEMADFKVEQCKTSSKGAAFIHYRSKQIEDVGKTDLKNHFSISSSVFGCREAFLNVFEKQYGEEIQLIGKKEI
jgi:2-polyprenyl-3-methyl-5-hydroxy-6-metoxy-1,4-benzoquinol methylase